MGTKEKGNYAHCVHMADSFYCLAQKAGENVIRMVEGYMYPYAVNIALSSELYLKAIQMYYDENDEFFVGHDLKYLYDQLPDHEKSEIRLRFENNERDEKLEEFLSKHKLVFLDWRYAFEEGKGGATINYSAFQRFVPSLQESIRLINSQMNDTGSYL